MGEFHLLGETPALEQTVRYFQEQQPKYLYPMHCTSPPELCAFYRTFGIKKLCTGDTVTI